MSLFVADASVAAKWCLPRGAETLVDEAFNFLNRYVVGDIQIIVPDLFWPELGNILWKASRQGRCTIDAAHVALRAMEERNFPTVPSLTLLALALELANAFGRTVYDSLYIALAVNSKAELITADERLAGAVASRLPVKWLGAPWP